MTELASPRLQFTRDGRRLVWADGERVGVRDATGANQVLAFAGVTALAAFGDQLWTVSSTGLERWGFDSRSLGGVVRGEGVLVPALVGPAAATWGSRLWLDDLGSFRELAIEEDAFPFAGRRVVVAVRQRGAIVARLGTTAWALPPGARLAAASALFDGAVVALIVERGTEREAWTSTSAGVLHQRITLPPGEIRIAARRGLAIVRDGGRVTAIDLRFGRVVGVGDLARDRGDLAIDPDGAVLALAGGGGLPTVCDLATVLQRRSITVASEPADITAEAPAVSEQAVALPRTEAAPTALAEPPSPVPDVQASIPVGPLLALAPRRPPAIRSRAHALAELDAELHLVATWTYGAIARDWDTRRLGYANESAHPHEHEVAAILGKNAGFAPELVAASRAEIEEALARAATGPDRRGPDTALGALAAELGLSPLAVDILLVVAAPAVWGDVARLYGILANDGGRPLVDELLVQHVLGGRVSRHDIARELDPRAPLVHSGAIEMTGRARPFAALTVDPVVLARLRGEPAELGAAVTLRPSTSELERFDAPRAILAAALAALARPSPQPARIVVRGRPGSGRRTLLAALGAEAHRQLAVVDPALLPRAPEAFAATLRRLLRRMHLAGLLPCVIQLDAIGFGDRDVADVAGDVLRAHPGPLAFTLGTGAAAPIDPGHVAVDLPVLEETERLALWRRELEAAGRWVRDVETIAARYRIGPGVIRRSIEAARDVADEADATSAIEGFIRQTRDARLAQIARRVDRLASWSSLVLPPDILDSLRELVARVRHRRTVYEAWGMGQMMATSRGITALFQGQPGTGKTLVAGVIARELGLDLYQVDLSKVMSKWIGETERNLATVFDAAEDGQVILLFDEADSLFARRTEVRSSNDRYANLEVNYLLQRLDAFEGIAILTTNVGGSIDPAFKRRMSFRLSFPFPDEDTRTQLWRAHLPPQLPIDGELALDRLARKYQLAGGYIRNACLRAAFLAAQDEGPLCQDHLERAVTLEFAELGKLSSSGAID